MAVTNDFILNKGWRYAGTCGCAHNMHRYLNDKYRGFEVRISVSNSTSFQIRQDGITKKQGVGLTQLTTMYNAMFT